MSLKTAAVTFVATVFAAIVLMPVRTAAAFAAFEDVPFSLDPSGDILIPVTVNGQGALTFLLDTGSNRSAVASDLAARLALPVVARADMVTPTGTQTQLVVRLARISIGSALSTDLLASVIPSEQLRAAMPGVDGIIGQDFLSAFNYTLDYRKHRLMWTVESTDASHEIRLALIPQEGRFLVELPQDARGRKSVRLVPDSGANGFVLFEGPTGSQLALDPAEGGSALVSVTGRQDARPMSLRKLQVGGVTLRNQPVVVIRRNDVGAPEGDGLLPLHLFASVSFNCREGYLVVRGR
jgi:predicted aspartyl protease